MVHGNGTRGKARNYCPGIPPEHEEDLLSCAVTGHGNRLHREAVRAIFQSLWIRSCRVLWDHPAQAEGPLVWLLRRPLAETGAARRKTAHDKE